MTETQTPDFDVTRATAIINVAMQGGMFPQGAMPESDTDKIVEAEKLYELARQADMVAQQIGKGNVPNYGVIEGVLFEAQVLVGANGNGSEAPSLPPTSSDSSAPSVQPSAAPTPSVPQEQTTTTGSSTISSSTLESSGSSSQPSDVLPEPQRNERWVDLGGGQWDVLSDRGPQLVVRSVATGEQTLVPTGFLKTRIEGATPFIHVEVRSRDNAVVFTHPGCGKWIAALNDDAIQGEVTCNECSMVLPVGEVTGVEPKEKPAASLAPSAPSAQGLEPYPMQPPPETSTTNAHAELPPAGVERGGGTASEPDAQVAVPRTSVEVPDDEGDEAYAKVLAKVEADFAPEHLPAPQDLENPPQLGSVEDPTQDEALNRVLHMQYNALFARARYLYGVEHAKARDCDRVAKRYLRAGMREARQQLGKDATVTEVREQAEESELYATWAARRDRHADRADAYKTFAEIYAENVKTLSRDLTFAGAEERGS